MPNRLLQEASPYLRQHAANPVDWYPFGEEAIERARREDRPIFLSIGYAACHWCHVMAEESFEDPAIADRLNAHFVPVKVDREERPDLDRIYQNISLMVTGQGGWPLSCWVTPDLRPFHVGTYFPPTDRYGRPGFASVLDGVAAAWRTRRDEVMRVAEDWFAGLCRMESPPPGVAAGLPASPLEPFAAALRAAYDPTAGGFGGAPKFPPHQHLDLLLRHFVRSAKPASLDMALATLRAMARGGIRDQLGGGFHRYAVDARWRVPHFEKMLYDNALLAPLYADAGALAGDAFLAQVAREVLADLDGSFSLPDGGFIASVDADSPAGEGAYYTWTAAEIAESAGEDAPVLLRHFGVDAAPGPVDGRHTLRRAAEGPEIAGELGRAEEGVQAAIARGSARLRAARALRPEPARDDKVLAGWNGLAVSAFAQAGVRLGESACVDRAERAARFALGHLLSPQGDLLRHCGAGTAIPGYLEDYAFLAKGFLDLHQATQESLWLERAEGIAQRAIALFWDPGAASFHQTRQGLPGLIVRPLDETDSATASGQSVLLEVLVRLLPFGADARREELVEEVLGRRARPLAEGHLGYSALAVAADLWQEGTTELALVPGPDDRALALSWLAEVQRAYLPGLAAGVVSPADPYPLAAGRTPVDGRLAAYVCRRRACSAPLTALARLREELRLPPRAETR